MLLKYFLLFTIIIFVYMHSKKVIPCINNHHKRKIPPSFFLGFFFPLFCHCIIIFYYYYCLSKVLYICLSWSRIRTYIKTKTGIYIFVFLFLLFFFSLLHFALFFFKAIRIKPNFSRLLCFFFPAPQQAPFDHSILVWYQVVKTGLWLLALDRC